MLTLGLNGWDDGTHDGAAVLVEDGTVLAFAEQERFSRRKHAVGEYPAQAAHSVLDETGYRPSDIDLVAYGWDLPNYYSSRGRTLEAENAAERLSGFEDLRGHEVSWIRHHDAHAAAAFHGSGFHDATIVIADAEGETESISIYLASSSGIRCLRRFGRAASLGLMYRAVSAYCGFGQAGAGKAMGLSAYGTPALKPLPLRFVDGEMVSPFNNEMSEGEVIGGWLKLLEDRFGLPPNTASSDPRFMPPSALRPDAAASVQHTLVNVMTDVVSYATDLTGSRNLCLSGGVALNCLQNASLLVNDRLRLTGVFIPPYPHDAGVALGSALIASDQMDGLATIRADLGSPVTSAETVLTAQSLGLPYREVECAATEAARFVEQGKVVGWVQGRMEVGPRALGHRSILASPGSLQIRDKVNRIKNREPWRPLAPSVLATEVPRLFGTDCRCPYMLLSLRASPEASSLIPGAVHNDGTARVQTVEPGSTPYALLLQRLEECSGVGAVLNTSFNGRGEPIVRSSKDALMCGGSLGLDAVVLDRILVELN